MDMDNGSDIAGFQPLFRNFFSQNYSVMFFDHTLLLYRGVVYLALANRPQEKH